MNESEGIALRSWLADIASDVLDTQTAASADADTPSGPVDARTAEWQASLPHLEDLPPAQREVLALRLRDGMDYPDIAVRLGLPLGTVHSRIARARGSLGKNTS
ncbi:MAG TPA: hypothetical protein DEQ98_04690 [Acidobacteria bacterium]|nr:hypothetical protein [Acidobacteriota bacterium]